MCDSVLSPRTRAASIKPRVERDSAEPWEPRRFTIKPAKRVAEDEILKKWLPPISVGYRYFTH